MSEVMKITNSDGTISNVDVVMSFKVEKTGNQYVIYKKNDEDGNMDTIYASLLLKNPDGSYILTDMSDEEWDYVKKVMANIVNSKED